VDGDARATIDGDDDTARVVVHVDDIDIDIDIDIVDGGCDGETDGKGRG